MDFNGILVLIIILALTVGLFFRQLTKWRDSESTLRTDDASGEQNEALRRDSESTSGTDHGSGEENKTIDPLGIEQGSNTTDKMKRNRSSEAIQSMDNMPTYQYDVFLSFCGGDTRRTFTDNLYYKMRDVGIHVFLDSEELEDGERINKVLKAVDKSRIYIPIFSQNFASRPWCLREVARMVERHSEPDEKREIIPIFYDVEPNDVKLRTDLYKKDILEHKRKEYFKPGEPEQWERALKEVGSMMGRELKGKRQGELIESIVKEVLRKLGKHVDLPRDLVEDYRQIKAIIEELDLNSGGVRFVGIHGIGGIGKTTLAKVVFKKLSSHFDRISFLDDVRKSSENGLVNLQKKLLTSVGSSSLAEGIQDIGDGMYWIEAICKTKKVLIVLDDLDNKEQLIKLAGKSYWFGSGSRIIITTRDESILKTPVESSSKENRNQPKEILCYAVREMAVDQALQLFYKHAFRSDSPIEDYVALSKAIVCKVAKLPLAIEVIGSYLYDLGSLDPYGDHKELWKETLKKLDEGPFKGVRDVLMISYKGLEDKQKEVFLDIACFFTDEDQTYPVIMWDDCKYHPRDAIGVLCLRSLIKIRDNKFWMHDQVRDLGRYIVSEEYPCKENPRKFSRVWTHEDAIELLERKERNEDVEALSLTFSGCNHNFTDEELAALSKLRFLQAKGSDFSGNFKNLLPKLRWLSWQTRQTNVQENFDAKNFHFSKLVVLSLSDSDIKDDWGGWSQMKMNELKVLDLTGCMHLQRTPNFSNFTSLETLILARCVKLTTIDRSIGMLKLLKTFNINRCRVLQELPEEFGSLQSLKEIIMPQNYQPFKLPETFGNLQSLSSFILDEHPGINKLPKSIGGLVKLTRLSLRGCVGIEELPCSIGDMEMLAELDLSNSGIVELPNSIGSLKKLKVIKVSYTRIKKFPRAIGQVEMLEELRAKKCWYLTDENLEEIEKLSNLKILDIAYTNVSRFPTVLGCLDRLEMLKMISREVQEVPDLPSSLTHLRMQARHFPSPPDLSSLVNLDYLELSILTGSMVGTNIAWTNDSLPSSLSTLKVRGILLPPFSNLKKLSEMFIIEYPMSEFSVSQDLTNLRILKLRKCLLLEKIPGLSHLKNLRCLDLNGLESLVEIHGLLELKSLEHFRIAHCKKLERLPDLSKLEKLQHIEIEACPKITEIKGVNGTESLKLGTRDFTVLDKLRDDPGSTWLFHKRSTYDVFVSFRGPDTRYNIVEFLRNNLVRNEILVYRDYEPVSHGYGMSDELMLALADSHIYIPILSPNYASSRWCLHELAHMVERQKSNGRRILPIFYYVEKRDVMLESDLYRGDLNIQRETYRNEVDEWEEALRCVGNMDGYNLKTNSLEEVIDLVTEEVLRELGYAGIRRPQAVEG